MFREPHEAILEFALAKIEEPTDELVEQQVWRELYYAALLLYSNDALTEATEYAALAADHYLPAAYLNLLVLRDIEIDTSEALADIRAREAALPPEQGFLYGFPVRYFSLDAHADYMAPIQHYAHYREIQEAIAEVRRAGDAPFQHHEMWAAFRWRDEDIRALEWLLRREELGRLSRQLLAQFKANVAAQLDGKADAEKALIETAFNDLIQRDDWAGTEYADFEDFKSKTTAASDLAQQLARLISDNRRLSPHNKMLLVEYCYLRGDLSVEDAFLMYFYVSKHSLAAAYGSGVAQEGLIYAGKKIIELLLSPVTLTGQVLTAAAAAALTELLKNFSAGSDAAPDIDLGKYRQIAAGTLPSEPSDYARFVDDFLRYLSQEREMLGEVKFTQRYPLEGFEDWWKKRP